MPTCIALYDHKMHQTCAAEPEPVTEVADGQLPNFEVGEWEDEDYVRPDYSISATVEHLHGWARVAGDSEFDISDRGYGECFKHFAFNLYFLV